MNLKKISKLQIARYIVQIISLFLMPGLFILTYENIKGVYISIITGNFSISTMLPSILNLIVILGMTVILGRFFCGWLCAFGTFMDIIYFISNKLFKIKFRVPEKVDYILKYIKYIILILSIGLVWSFQSKFLDNKDPWDAFAQFPDIHSMIFSHTLAFVILLFIILGAVFIERFFCRYLCPLGAVFALISKIRFIKINKVSDKCGKCRVCTSNCVMGIQMYKNDVIRSGECIDCLKCSTVCPRKNVKVKVAEETIAPALAAGIAVTALVALNEGTNYIDKLTAKKISYVSDANIVSNKATSQEAVSQSNVNAAENNLDKVVSTKQNTNSKYKEGIFTGTGTGFRPGDEMQVTIKDGKITNIEVVSSNDTPNFFGRAYNQVIPEIINSQSTDVDTVSGATMSSDGIIQGVQNALIKATK